MQLGKKRGIDHGIVILIRTLVKTEHQASTSQYFTNISLGPESPPIIFVF